MYIFCACSSFPQKSRESEIEREWAKNKSKRRNTLCLLCSIMLQKANHSIPNVDEEQQKKNNSDLILRSMTRASNEQRASKQPCRNQNKKKNRNFFSVSDHTPPNFQLLNVFQRPQRICGQPWIQLGHLININSAEKNEFSFHFAYYLMEKNNFSLNLLSGHMQSMRLQFISIWNSESKKKER